MAETKRWRKKELFRHFGLIGYPLGHSLSPLIHERIMEAIDLPGEYKLYELRPEELPAKIFKLLEGLDGYNCTLPHKEAIIPYLDHLAPSASLYGAVNTVCGRIGYNTDGVAFAACKVPMEGQDVCVLGAGGVARVLIMEAIRADAKEIVVQARNLQRAEALVAEVQGRGYRDVRVVQGKAGDRVNCKVLLNGTPVGMWPQVRQIPVSDSQLKNAVAVFDTIYNPTATRLVLKAKSVGIRAKGGLQMLFEQALAAQKIWNPEVDFGRFAGELSQASQGLAKEVLRMSPIKLVLTGFMGSGKTHAGQALARAMSLPFVDLDEVITKAAGTSIPEIFISQGEGGFRSLEKQAFLEQLRRPEALVLATGGGTLVQEGMIEAIRKFNALVIYLDVPFGVALERIGGDQERPLLQLGVEEIRNLYRYRKPLYEAIADLKVVAHGRSAQVVKTIMAAFGWEL